MTELQLAQAAVRKAVRELDAAEGASASPDELERLHGVLREAANVLSAHWPEIVDAAAKSSAKGLRLQLSGKGKASKRETPAAERRRMAGRTKEEEQAVLADLKRRLGPTETRAQARDGFPHSPHGPLPWRERFDFEWRAAGKGGRWNKGLPANTLFERFEDEKRELERRAGLRKKAPKLRKHSHIDKDLIVRVAQRLLREPGMALRQLPTAIFEDDEIEEARKDLERKDLERRVATLRLKYCLPQHRQIDPNDPRLPPRGLPINTYNRSKICAVLVERGIRKRRKS